MRSCSSRSIMTTNISMTRVDNIRGTDRLERQVLGHVVNGVFSPDVFIGLANRSAMALVKTLKRRRV